MKAEFPLPKPMSDEDQHAALLSLWGVSSVVTQTVDLAARTVNSTLAGAAAVAATMRKPSDLATAFARIGEGLELHRSMLREGWMRYALAIACQTERPIEWCAVLQEMEGGPTDRHHAAFPIAYSALQRGMSFADAYLAVDAVDMLLDRADQEGRRLIAAAESIDALCGRDPMSMDKGTDISWVALHLTGDHALHHAREAIVDYMDEEFEEYDARHGDPPELRSNALAVMAMHRLDGLIHAARANALHSYALDQIAGFREEMGLASVDAIIRSASGPLVHAGLIPEARRARTTAARALVRHKPMPLPNDDGALLLAIETSNRIDALIMGQAAQRR